MNGAQPIRLAAANRQSPRDDFPIFAAHPGLAYLDSGASAQKPQSVIDAVSNFYSTGYANIHRGVYRLSSEATDAFEFGREAVRRFVNAASSREIVFVRGATEGINLLAYCLGRTLLKAGDQVLITELEHHANIVPWQILRDTIGIELVVAPIDASGGLDRAAFTRLLTPQTKLVAVTHIANATGAVNPVADIVHLAHEAGAQVLIDGSQAVPHRAVDVQALDADYYVFSGHKLYGPTGIGVVYGKAALMEILPPYQTGGDMIASVTFEHTDFQDIPHRFEAGTPDIAGVIGLTAAIDYIDQLGWDWIRAHERELLDYGVEMLNGIPGVHLVGAGAERSGVLSFTVDGIHPHDLGTILDQSNVAIRAGNHCAQPLMAKLGLYASARASLGLYNERSDLDALKAAILRAQELFGR
jgi:cysteine desulfurase/selenocysteine lyase